MSEIIIGCPACGEETVFDQRHQAFEKIWLAKTEQLRDYEAALERLLVIQGLEAKKLVSETLAKWKAQK